MIDLNSTEFDREYVDIDDIYKYTDDYQIFKNYMEGYLPGDGNTNSPLRVDNIPSFSIFYGDKNGKYMYKDFATGESGDAIVFVKRYYEERGLFLNFNQTLLKIVDDLNLPLKSLNNKDQLKQIRTSPKPKKSKEQVTIKVKFRSFLNKDKEFWEQFGITKNTLLFYNVYPITHIFLNDNIIKADNISYAYIEYKDGVPTYKIYQPYSKKMKFINNNDYSVWEGWEQMDSNEDHLIITSSRKDIMSVRDTAKLNSTSLQAESVIPKNHVVQDLKNNYTDIFVLYDNDKGKKENYGQILANKLVGKYGFYNLVIPDKYASKDYSDLVKNHGKYKASQILYELIDNKLNN